MIARQHLAMAQRAEHAATRRVNTQGRAKGHVCAALSGQDHPLDCGALSPNGHVRHWT